MAMRASTGERRFKQVTLTVTLADWRAIRAEALRRRLPITELCRLWMHAEIEAARERHS